MLNPRQVARFINENIGDGILYSEKSVQKLIWKLLKKRYVVDPLQNIIIDTCWANDTDSKYTWKMFTMNHFKDLYKGVAIDLPTPGEKLARKEIDVLETFYKMYTARIIPLIPLEPSGTGNGEGCSGKNNLLQDDPINVNSSNTVTNLKPTISITPTTGANNGGSSNTLYNGTSTTPGSTKRSSYN